MSLSVKRRSAETPFIETPVPFKRLKRAAVHPPSRYEDSDPALEKALRVSREALEKPAQAPRARKPLNCGRFEKALTAKHREIHERIVQYLHKAKTTYVTELDLRRMCLPKDPSTQVPKNLRIVEVPGLGKGVFLSRFAKSIKVKDTIGIYEGTIHLIYKYRSEEISAYKWTLFDYALEREEGQCPVEALKGWSEVVDGGKTLSFTALINACHPDHPEDANVAPHLVLLTAPDGSVSVQLLYVTLRPILPGEQLLVDYGKAYFKNLEIIPLRVTPCSYTLNDQETLAIEAPQSSSSSSSSSSSRSSAPLDDDDDNKESLPNVTEAPVLPPPSNAGPRLLPLLRIPICSYTLNDQGPLAIEASQSSSPSSSSSSSRSSASLDDDDDNKESLPNAIEAPVLPPPSNAEPRSLPPLRIPIFGKLTLEEIDRRIEKIKTFLLHLGLVDRPMQELRTALQTLEFPKGLFNFFYEEIKRALRTSSSPSERDLAISLKGQLHHFIKILWGKEESEDSCLDLLFSLEAPFWWIKPHAHFVQIFTRRERCHHPAVSYIP
jgi:hypothetical protein